MKGRQDNWGQRSARCQAERRSGASLHSPKAQSLRSFFCIQASKLSVKYSCDNAGGSEQRRLANLSSTTRWIFRGRKGKKVKIAKQNSALFPTACRPHMQLCEHRISPNVVYHQRLGGKVITGLYYMICTHTHNCCCCSHARYCHSSRTRGAFECRPVLLLLQTHMPNDDQRFDTASRNLWPLVCAARNLFLLPDIESFSMS
jgi:hypothetical protein